MNKVIKETVIAHVVNARYIVVIQGENLIRLQGLDSSLYSDLEFSQVSHCLNNLIKLLYRD